MATLAAIQSPASVAFHALRAAGVETADHSTHTSWFEDAAKLKEAASALTEQRVATLKMLSNMGVQFSAEQQRAAKTIEEKCDVTEMLARLESALQAGQADGPFLVGDGALISAVDIDLAHAVHPFLSLVYSSTEYPRVSNWLSAVLTVSQVADALKITNLRLLGQRRIGSQIDRRPTPEEARAGALAAIERNAGYKKKDSQRKKEKAAKAAAKAAEDAAKAKAKAKAEGDDGDGDAGALKYSLSGRIEVDAGKSARMDAITAAIGSLSISATTTEHVATPTVEALIEATGHLPGGHCKNLFLKAKKPSRTIENDSKLWLIVALHDTKVDIKKFSKSMGYKDAMRMGKADLLNEKLGCVQGEVSPLALMNNVDGDVKVALDSRMMSETQLWFHPLTMEASTAISPADLLKFIEATGRKAHIVDF